MSEVKYCAVYVYGENVTIAKKTSDIYLANCHGLYTIEARESDIVFADYGKKTTLRVFLDDTKTRSAPVFVRKIAGKFINIYLHLEMIRKKM